MSIHCPDCGAVAGYGHELGHRSDCPSLSPKPRASKPVSHDIDQISLEAAQAIEYFRWFNEPRRIAATQKRIVEAIKTCQRPEETR
jgi:hypothetical protein